MARVLVVTDDVYRQQQVLDTLAEAGHEPVLPGAPTGGRAAVALVDVAGAGRSALSELLASCDAPPVVACGALHDHARVMEALAAGAAGFLFRPFSAAQLLRVLAVTAR